MTDMDDNRRKILVKQFDQGDRDRAVLIELNKSGLIERVPFSDPVEWRLSELGLYWLPRD